jgi:hypothetical protein
VIGLPLRGGACYSFIFLVRETAANNNTRKTGSCPSFTNRKDKWRRRGTFHWARKRPFYIVQLCFDKQIQEVITIYVNLFSIEYLEYCLMDVEPA